MNKIEILTFYETLKLEPSALFASSLPSFPASNLSVRVRPCAACRGEARQGEDGSVAIRYKNSPQSTPRTQRFFLIFLSGLSALRGEFFPLKTNKDLLFEQWLLSPSRYCRL